MSRAAKGFPPVIDAKIETLILGSFPGVASLVKAQYYGHPQNHFWRLVGAVIEEPLAQMDYEARKRTLLKHHIGLWDVIDACRREGSLDSLPLFRIGIDDIDGCSHRTFQWAQRRIRRHHSRWGRDAPTSLNGPPRVAAILPVWPRAPRTWPTPIRRAGRA